MELFDVINKEDNINLNSLSKENLIELKSFFDNYLIDYKKNLNIDNNFTFGFEIEFAFKNKNIFNYDNIYKTWKVVEETTVKNGKEINSPILHDSKITWGRLKKICDYLNEFTFINTGCGGHIHIGNQFFENKENVDKFLLLWSIYENICYRFFYGEFSTCRPLTVQYACPIANSVLLDNGETYNSFSPFHLKFMGVSLGFKKDYENCFLYNTTEIRVPNGTINPIIWQNNLYFLYKLIEYSKCDNFDFELLNYRDENNREQNLYNLFKYKNIYYNQAFELADLIFDNNFDKVNFLKQYFKDYNDTYLVYKKLKNFTKYDK